MKITKLNLGELVAVNDLPDGQVYQVAGKEKFTVELHYKTNGYDLHGGFIDVDRCRKPIKAQLDSYIKTM